MGNNEKTQDCQCPYDKVATIKLLRDANSEISKDALQDIIDKEFFVGENSFSSEVVEAAVIRLALMDHGATDDETLQQVREDMIREVMERIWGLRK